MRKNQGYTLVEMIIVIAIIAIMSGVSAVTIGVIKQARCNVAIDTFNNQLAGLLLKSRAMSQGKIQSSGSDESQQYPLCMRIMKNADGEYEMTLGYYTLDLTSGYLDTGFVKKSQDADLGTLTDLVDIIYTSTDDDTYVTSPHDLEDGPIIIQFNKSDGSVKYGSGVYVFKYQNRDYGTITLDKVTGNHYRTKN